MVVLGGLLLMRAQKKRPCVVGRALIGHGKWLEHAQSGVHFLIGAQIECVKTHALHIEQLINQYVTDGAQFVFKIQTVAQQIGDAVAAPVGEFRVVQRNHGEAIPVKLQRFWLGRVLQPNADVGTTLQS